MKPSRARRHCWNELDACVECGVARHGYGGGRTGSLRYVWPDGHWSTRAGECPGREAKHVRGGNCWAPPTRNDVCMKHEQARGECDECPRCPKCAEETETR